MRTPVEVSALLLGSFAWGAPAAVTALLCHLARTCTAGVSLEIMAAVQGPNVAVLLPWTRVDFAAVGMKCLPHDSAGELCTVTCSMPEV